MLWEEMYGREVCKMGKLWKDCSREELVLNYHGILWGLEHKSHNLVRDRDGTKYVIPQPTSNFERDIKWGMLGAKSSIESIWQKRYGDEAIPACDLTQISWEDYRVLAGLPDPNEVVLELNENPEMKVRKNLQPGDLLEALPGSAVTMTHRRTRNVRPVITDPTNVIGYVRGSTISNDNSPYSEGVVLVNRIIPVVDKRNPVRRTSEIDWWKPTGSDESEYQVIGKVLGFGLGMDDYSDYLGREGLTLSDKEEENLRKKLTDSLERLVS